MREWNGEQRACRQIVVLDSDAALPGRLANTNASEGWERTEREPPFGACYLCKSSPRRGGKWWVRLESGRPRWACSRQCVELANAGVEDWP